MSEHYDIIIVGGGSAGCVAAARLTEDPKRKVLLLERGPDPQPLPTLLSDPNSAPRLKLETPYVAQYPTRRKLDGSTFDSLAGIVLGGGSSVNMLSIVRPVPGDCESWVKYGNSNWSWLEVLSVLKRIEADQDFPNSPLHGSSGPLFVKRHVNINDRLAGLEKAIVEGALSLGLPLCPDQNIAKPFGICPVVFNARNGKRQSAAVAYLEPARSRANLTLVAEGLVTKLKVKGDRVIAVEYAQRGQMRTVTGDQVVLSAGVYHSPQILMLSGIGPIPELGRHGIEVTHALPGVGENYQDQAVVNMTFQGKRRHEDPWVTPRLILNWKSDPSREYADIHIIARAPVATETSQVVNRISAYLLEHRSRGRVTLKSNDCEAPPEIDARLLEDPEDHSAMVKAMHFVNHLTQTKPMQKYCGELLAPSIGDSWGTFALANYDCFHHGCGTCMMGPPSNEMAVVDQTLRVHGMTNLWVADVSVLPTIPHAHTNIVAMMIGERLSDFITEYI